MLVFKNLYVTHDGQSCHNKTRITEQKYHAESQVLLFFSFSCKEVKSRQPKVGHENRSKNRKFNAGTSYTSLPTCTWLFEILLERFFMEMHDSMSWENYHN